MLSTTIDIYRAFLSELEKLCAPQMEKEAAARWATLLRKAEPEKARSMIRNLYYAEGVRPPALSVVDAAARERAIKNLRTFGKAAIPNTIVRGSPEWRAAMQDIRHGRFTRLETGTSENAAAGIVRHGPAGIADLPLAENMPGVQGWSDRIRRAVRTAEDMGADDVADALLRKLKQGLYAADAGTSRTAEYAHRAAGVVGAGKPVKVSFDLPASMATPNKGLEFRVPNGLWRQWARNVSIDHPWPGGPSITTIPNKLPLP